MREVKIPSCGTVKAGFRTIYTVWMKMMRLCSCTGSQRLEHLGRRSADVFHLEAVIVYNFPHLFWAQSGMFLRCHKKRRWVQRSAAEKMCGFEISLWDRGMSPPPSRSSSLSSEVEDVTRQLGRDDEMTQSSVQTDDSHLFL